MTRRPRGLVVAGVLVLAGPWVGCGHAAPKDGAARVVEGGVAASPGDAAVSRVNLLSMIERAEDGRRFGDVQEAWLTAGDVEVRRRAMRAVARIADPAGDPLVDAPLLRGLGDEDLEVVAWAAYGLGWACKGREDTHVKALAARAATLADRDASATVTHRDVLDAPASILRAIGRCGGALAEGTLAGFLRVPGGDAAAEEAAYALGSIAGRHTLADETMGALLDRAEGDPASVASAAALFPIGRLDHVPDPWSVRVMNAARAVLAHASPLRGFALRAMEKVGAPGAAELGRAASTVDLGAPERAEAARALGRLGAPGHEAAGAALGRMLHDHDLLDPASLSGDSFNVLLAVLEALGPDAPKSSDASLYPIASLSLTGKAPALARRVATLRCTAAGALARAAYDADILARCDPDPEGAAGQRARLVALLRRPIVAERRRAFRALSASTHIAVRESALEAIAQHPELDEMGRALLVGALAATEPGVVATAAQTIVQHPERVLTLAKSERRAALDPRSPPPTSHPAMDLPPDVGAGLSHALARAWREDAIETRTSLLDAAVAVSLPDARAAATRACTDVNITMREHAVRALRALGDPQPSCPMPASKDAPAAKPSTGVSPVTHPTRVTFEVDGAKLSIVFEPELTPVATSRFVALARAGFYRGIVVHRVVPGYVVQFGDPGADGYGGSGELLRCETSPVPFGALDVGVALAGRDTGSSQLFVSLGRYPKLDGDYARVGRAEGDWGAVAEGDVIGEVKVEE